jgi:hypothetical protein
MKYSKSGVESGVTVLEDGEMSSKGLPVDPMPGDQNNRPRPPD